MKVRCSVRATSEGWLRCRVQPGAACGFERMSVPSASMLLDEALVLGLRAVAPDDAVGPRGPGGLVDPPSRLASSSSPTPVTDRRRKAMILGGAPARRSTAVAPGWGSPYSASIHAHKAGGLMRIGCRTMLRWALPWRRRRRRAAEPAAGWPRAGRGAAAPGSAHDGRLVRAGDLRLRRTHDGHAASRTGATSATRSSTAACPSTAASWCARVTRPDAVSVFGTFIRRHRHGHDVPPERRPGGRGGRRWLAPPAADVAPQLVVFPEGRTVAYTLVCGQGLRPGGDRSSTSWTRARERRQRATTTSRPSPRSGTGTGVLERPEEDERARVERGRVPGRGPTASAGHLSTFDLEGNFGARSSSSS